MGQPPAAYQDLTANLYRPPVEFPEDSTKVSIYGLLNSNHLPLIRNGFNGLSSGQGLDDRINAAVEILSGQLGRDVHDIGAKNTKFRDYVELERRIVQSLNQYVSLQSYGSVAINDITDRYRSTLGYIDILAQRSLDEKRKAVNPKIIKKLKIAVTKVIIRRLPNYYKHLLEDGELYRAAKRAIDARKPKARTAMAKL